MAKTKDSEQIEVQDEGKVKIDKDCFNAVEPNKYNDDVMPVLEDLEREFKQNKLFILN